jgi:deoxyribodipyrimidine photolyase
MTALLWYRRDLRLADHPALHAALEGAQARREALARYRVG